MTERTNAEIVLQAIQDLHAQEQVVTRETLRDVTGLVLTIIDDRVASLIDSGQVFRIQRGVFIPAPQHRPARIIGRYVLPDGTTKIEIGDDHVLTLTPRESRALGELMAGAGHQFSAIEMGRQAVETANEMNMRLKQLRKDLNQVCKQRSEQHSMSCED